MTAWLRRKQYFTERGMQLRFARFVILFVFVSSLLTALTIFYTTFLMLGERLAQVYPQGRLVEIFHSAHVAFLINILLILPVIFFGSILFSHRIAGPLPKIYQALHAIGQGNFETKVVLRKHDELKDLVEAINAMSAELKKREASRE